MCTLQPLVGCVLWTNLQTLLPFLGLSPKLLAHVWCQSCAEHAKVLTANTTHTQTSHHRVTISLSLSLSISLSLSVSLTLYLSLSLSLCLYLCLSLSLFLSPTYSLSPASLCEINQIRLCPVEVPGKNSIFATCIREESGLI